MRGAPADGRVAFLEVLSLLAKGPAKQANKYQSI